MERYACAIPDFKVTFVKIKAVLVPSILAKMAVFVFRRALVTLVFAKLALLEPIAKLV